MKKINEIVKTNETNLKITPELEAQWFNEDVGELNLDDGIDCPICKNKGKVAYVEDKYMLIKNCECMKARITFNRLRNCGITKNVLEHLSFKNWQTTEKWQKDLKKICIDFFNDIKNGNNYWFIISGQTGGGKTFLCTALFQELIKQLYKTGLYMLWNNDIPKLISLRKSSFIDNQEKYDELIKKYKDIDILYIDDLFKLDARYKDDGLSLCYEILNHRYINGKITIISTETERNDFEKIDEALWGRCLEMTKQSDYWLTITGVEKNYRNKGE